MEGNQIWEQPKEGVPVRFYSGYFWAQAPAAQKEPSRPLRFKDVTVVDGLLREMV